MGDKTTIEWVKNPDGSRGATWNPITGCSKVSPGCDHCFAERLALGRHRRFYPKGFGEIQLRHDRLDTPLRWQKPKMIFTCSMSDLFHPRVPFDFIRQVFATMEETPRHTYQVLSKRPGRMAYFARVGLEGIWPPNVWAGTSVESARYLPRLDVLARVPAPVRFVSAEPLLSALDLRPWLLPQRGYRPFLDEPPVLSWVICGTESGPGRRPMEPDWARSLRDQCLAASVPFFLKQMEIDGKVRSMPLLDGVEHKEMPKEVYNSPLQGRS